LSTCFIEWCEWLHLCSFCVHLQAKIQHFHVLWLSWPTDEAPKYRL
jgi:hypothetical protein